MSSEPPDERRVFPEDVLAALLDYAARAREEPGGPEAEEARHFKTYDFDLQEIFAELTSQYDVLNRYFLFTTSGPEPFSPALNNALSELQLGGVIARQNPEYQVLVLKRTGHEYVEEELQGVLEEEFSDEDMAQLRQAAHDFNDRVLG